MIEEKKSYYAIIPANVRYDKRLNANAKLMYGELTALCNEKGYCWATNQYFANLYEVSHETISRWISRLKKYNYIHIDLIYSEKQVVERRIYIDFKINTIDENVNTPPQKDQYPIDENVKYPIDENVKDNITLFNNTNNNTSNIYIDKIKTLFSIWLNSNLAGDNLIKHSWNTVEKRIFQKNGKIKEKFKEILDENNIDYYIDCIHNYAEIKNNQTRYWYNYGWTFWDFLSRGYLKFGNECNPRENFLIIDNKIRKNNKLINDTQMAYLLLKNKNKENKNE